MAAASARRNTAMAAMPARREIVCVRLCHAAAMAALSARRE